MERMYQRFCLRKGLTCKILDERSSGKELRSTTLLVKGQGADRLLAESGAHSIQHTTRSRSDGRIHTSTVTVAVFPAASQDEVRKAMNAGEIRVDTFRGSGRGGQHRNTCDSAVRAVHLPTGEMATVTSGRSQSQNRERALAVLCGRLEKREKELRKNAEEKERRRQTSAHRAQAIRTYDLVRGVVRSSEGRKFYAVRQILDGDLDRLL